MGFYEVYSEPVLIRYKSRVCSRASVFVVCVCLLTYIPPLLMAYRSQGFWLKQSTYEEQPLVQFQYQMMLIGATSLTGDYVAWSTFSKFNSLLGNNLRIPAVSVREDDRNGDGKSDGLNVQLSVPLSPSEQIYSVQLLLTFNYQLMRMATVVMQSMVLVQHSSAVPGSQLFISGDLKLQQRSALPHRGIITQYNVSVVDASSPFASSYDLTNIIRSYQNRNLSTYLLCTTPVWTVARAAGAPFQIEVEIRYPVETITGRDSGS
ncbi:transmembrane protein 231 isoform X2 [Trichomycterus rosablanca]|uniref:transmembrane protein 231 isoform X2 n=1 Tax=Trichomycterus rosablanca TaxID=2290929 RepID=UPI002F35C79F